MDSRPPRLPQMLLRAVMTPEDAEVIGGDLDEMFDTALLTGGPRRARRWYWRQAISIVFARLRERDPSDAHSTTRGMTMAGIRQDAAYAVRSLRRQPGFAAMAVLMLALGIGATLAIASLAHAVLFKPLPFPDPDRLALVHLLVPDRESPGVFRPIVWSWPKYRLFRETQEIFDPPGLFAAAAWNLTAAGGPERISGEAIEAAYLRVLGVSAHIGRTFADDDTRAPGAAPIALLGHGLWTRSFGSDPSILGRSVGLNGTTHTIVGVLPRGFRGLTGQAEVWTPVTTLGAEDLDQPFSHSYSVVARRKPGVSPDVAREAMRVIGDRIDRQFPNPFGQRWSATTSPIDDERADVLVRRSILLLFASVAAVLLIVCLNLANLMLVRGLGREREVAIRHALGASRLRIVRQLMTESALLALAGAAAGIAVAWTILSAGAALMPDLRTVLPQGRTAGLTRVGLGLLGPDATLLVFAGAVAAGAALLFGLGPAWGASGRALTSGMKAGASGAIALGTRGFALRNVLIVGEIALALVLLMAGGLMLRSVWRLQAADLGFDPSSLLTLRVALPATQYDMPRATQLLHELVERVGQHAGIESAAYGSCAPVSGGCNGTLASFPGRPPAPRGSGPQVGVLWASPGYFETLGIRLVRGRVFTGHDRIGQPKVVVINETAARAFWGNEDPIGQRIGVGQGGFADGAEVVGVVADVRYREVERSVEPDVYLPLLQSGRTGGLIFVRSRMSPAAILPEIRAAVQALDPNLPVADVRMMEARFGDATWRTRMSAWVLGAFAALALLVAAIGVYGVMSHGVEQRTREIGVRLALGAGRADILRLILGRTLAIALAGVALGIVLSLPAMRLLASLLYQVSPGDPLVLTTLALLLLAAAVLAGYLPARRATRVDPLATLRAE